MAQFKNTQFMFDGRLGDEFGLYLVNVGEGNYERQVGWDRSVVTSEGLAGATAIASITGNAPTFSLQFVKADKQMNPIPITQEDMFKINKWFFGVHDYKPFISMDNQGVVYYGMFIKGKLWQNGLGQGYLTLDFQLNSPFAYGAMQEVNVNVRGVEAVDITIKNNVDEFVYPDFEFKLLDGQTGFEVENTTLGESMEFFALDDTSTHGYVYNDGLKHVVSLIDSSVNMRKHSNGNFLKLAYGVNKMKIYGNGSFTFFIQPRMALQ